MNPWVTVLAAAAVPFFLVAYALRLGRMDFPRIENQHVFLRYRYVDSLFTRSIVAANPIGGALMLLMLGVVAICAAILGASWAIFDTLKFDVAGVTSWRLSFPRHSH